MYPWATTMRSAHDRITCTALPSDYIMVLQSHEGLFTQDTEYLSNNPVSTTLCWKGGFIFPYGRIFGCVRVALPFHFGIYDAERLIDGITSPNVSDISHSFPLPSV